MKKKCATFLAAVCSVGMLLPHTMTASAADDFSDTLSYDFYFAPTRTSISSGETAAGDVVISMPMYLYGSTANLFRTASVQYSSDSDHLYFRNMITGSTRFDSPTSYETSLGTLTTDYMPYCFGMLRPDGSYVYDGASIETKGTILVPGYHSPLYSAGNGQVKFTAAYQPNAEADRITQEFICDVTTDENGNGIYSFRYVDPVTFVSRTITGKIPRYDPTLPEGTPIPGTCDSLFWASASSGDSAEGASLFGETANEFPLFQIDLVVEQGTPCGIYNITFDTASENPAVTGCYLTSESRKNYPLHLKNTSIAVGVKRAVVTSIVKEEAAFYASHDTHAITGADFAAQILADITYEDGSTEQNVDITNLVSCNGATPADLYTAADNGCFISDVPLCIGSTPVKNSDGSNLTQHILVGMKGDVNFNGKVDMTDAYNVLLYNSKASIGQTPVFCDHPTDPYQETLAYFLADVDTCSKSGKTGGKISMTDAYHVLIYTSYQALGQKIPWDSMIK